MIELGDIITFNRGSDARWGVATEADFEELRIARYQEMYRSYQGSSVYTQDQIRDLLRSGPISKRKNVEEDTLGSMKLGNKNSVSLRMDVEATERVYEAVESGEYPSFLSSSTVVWDACNGTSVEIEEVGWEHDTLADDLIKLKDGSVESYTTVAEAMKRGIWILMQTENPRIEGNKKVAVDLEVDPDSGKIVR